MRGKQLREQKPSILEQYPLASLIAAAIVSIWLVTRVLLFSHMHERAGDHMDLGHLRQTKIRGVDEAELKAHMSGLALQRIAVTEAKASSSAVKETQGDDCHPKVNILFGGATVFAPGGSPTQHAESTAECCKACKEFKDCNVWTFHPGSKKCTLKRAGNAWNPQILAQGDSVAETSGSLFDMGKKWDGSGGSIHTVLTSNGNSYMNWQSRVMYATYLKVAGGPMKAFTRVLHRHTDDELMIEIPTMRFDPVHINCDEYCSFPVADRSPALVEWMRTPDSRQCTHILLVETDYLFVKQIPASILPAHGYAQAFPYGYIQPGYPGVMEIGRRFVPGMDEADVPATGNAPVLMTRPDFETIIPVWADIVLQIENDTVAVQRLGWIRDMYAWSFAAAKTKITHVLPLPPHNPLMVQPPADRELGEGCILHYTWGPQVFNAKDELIWEFDKRSYAGGQYAPGPRELIKLNMTPPYAPGMHLQSFFSEGNVVTENGLGLMRLLVETFNGAVDTLSVLPKGWTDLEAAKKAALPSEEAKKLADKVQAEIAREEARARGENVLRRASWRR